ncbi:MAG: membrane dipeptidase [Aureliella sp.]
MLIFDAHLDLSFNALTFNRDLRLQLDAMRKSEAGLVDLPGRERATVCFPEMRKANIGICVATQLAGCMKPAGPGGGWNSPEIAWAVAQGQLAWYRSMEQVGELRQITSRRQLDEHLVQWQAAPDESPIGYILSLEGADSIRTLDDLAIARDQGLRALGPAHYGCGRYAPGHDVEGPLSDQGQRLVKAMDELDLILDATHLSEVAMLEALEVFSGPVWASHHNCRALVDDPRQLSDQQIKVLAQRGAVIGMAMDVWMVVPDWRRGETTHADRTDATLSALADHVDHICQLLGNANHIGIGTDLDGGFGTEQTPADLNSIADVQKFVEILKERGYSDRDLERISSGNFLSFVRRAWDH